MAKQKMSSEDAQSLGDKLGVNWNQIPLEEFRRGLEVELEHGAHDPETDVTHDDLTLTGQDRVGAPQGVPRLLHAP